MQEEGVKLSGSGICRCTETNSGYSPFFFFVVKMARTAFYLHPIKNL